MAKKAAAKKKAKKKAKAAKKKEEATEEVSLPPPPPIPPGFETPKAVVAKTETEAKVPNTEMTLSVTTESAPQVIKAAPTLQEPVQVPTVQEVPDTQMPPPVPVPQPGPFAGVKLSPPEGNRRSPSFAMFRQYVAKWASNDPAIPSLFTQQEWTEIDAALCFVQTASPEELVTEYPRILGFFGYWKNHAKYEEHEAEKYLRKVEALSDRVVRTELTTAGDKITEAKVTAAKRIRPDVEAARNKRDIYTNMVFQFDALLGAMNKDMLVQASLWSRPDKAIASY